MLLTETTRRDQLPGVAGWLAAPAINRDQGSHSIGERNLSNSVIPAPGAVVLAGDQVLAIAQADAARAYRDLLAYRIQLMLEDDGWHVDYELKDPRLKGGGPHYVIDAHTGTILSKRYEQ